MKSAMKKVIGKLLLKVDEFAYTVIRMEGILNTRPITLMDDDIMNILQPTDFINPKVIMLSREDSSLAESDHGLLKLSGGKKKLQALYRKIEESVNRFQRKWTRRYL